ncbi:MAG: class I SAM-dependent methyltransferase [Chitinophagaceae bacterium]
MANALRSLKKIWVLNFVRRLFNASKVYNRKYSQIIKWGFSSNEDTNYTYNLTDDNIVYMAQMISFVTKTDYSVILGYIKEAESNNELKNHIIATTKNSELNRYADKEVRFGKRLGWYAFVRALKPRIIIETGIDKGLGSVLLCAALGKNAEEGYEGHYYGTDINPKAGYLLNDKYKKFGTILYGDSIASLANFKEKIDLFINDSDHSADYEYREYNTIKPLLKETTLILGDNSHSTNKLSQFSLENNRQFLFFQEVPANHWYPGGGIGISFN